MKSAVYISDKAVILKLGQGNQTENDNVGPEQGYNHAKFERSSFNGVKEKASIKLLFFK